MAKRSGSKSSRSERKADRERARQRQERGLPEPPARRPLRARAATPEPSGSEHVGRPSDAPVSPPTTGIPPFVWVVGGALLILVVAYFVSQRRDAALTTQPEPEAPSASVASSATELPVAEPSVTASDPPAPTPQQLQPVPAEPVVPPTEPSVAAPVVSAPSKPRVDKPKAATVPAPKAPTPPAQPAQPVDNPY